MSVTHQIEESLTKSGNYIHGRDSEDAEITYCSIAEWKAQIGLLPATATATSKENDAVTSFRQTWYGKGYEYWEDESNCPATVDGVLGGYACLSSRDLEGSKDFLAHLKSSIRPQWKITREENGGVATCACECGAGIGRVSKGLLLPLGITRCDLIEPSPRLISSAPDYLGEPYSSQCRFFCLGLQDFEPKPGAYDIIWIQWVIGYLTDDDLVCFFHRCAAALREGGVVVVKDNTCENEAFIVDRADASITRSLPFILELAKMAGLRVIYQDYQQGFPGSIFPVPIIALEPIESKSDNT